MTDRPDPLGIAALCRLDDGLVDHVRQGRGLGRIGLWAVGLMVACAALYGYPFGAWRSPLQGLYAAVKLPLLLVAIVLGSALINGVLARVLRAGIGVAQGAVCILLSLSLASVLLAAWSPVGLLLVLSVPGPGQPGFSGAELHRVAEGVLFAHIVVVGACGIAANLHLFRLLRRLVGSTAVARRVLFGWVVVDGLLGMQLSWILRPFLCKPDLEPQLLRPDALDGNFLEELGRILAPVAGSHWLLLVAVTLAVLLAVPRALGGEEGPAAAPGDGPYRAAARERPTRVGIDS